MTAMALADWGPLMDAGVTTYAVGPVPCPQAVYADRTEAEAAADELDGTYIEWSGHHGRQVLTADLEAAAPEPEAEI
jgi:hypothetical protein